MTYGQPAVCRRGGCGQPAEERHGDPGDVGWCEVHGREIRAARHLATVGAPQGRGKATHLGPRQEER